MKKFCALIVLFVSLFISCSSEPDNERLFKDAVQEVYRLTGELLFNSPDGINPYYTPNGNRAYNKVSGPNETPGICIDYTIEFINFWNNVKNYDEVFGRAYFASHHAVNLMFRIQDGEVVPDGTSHLVTWVPHFSYGNEYEADGVLHDVFFTDTLFEKPGGVPHFQWNYMIEHMWAVILFEGSWYATDPTQWDVGPLDYIPYKVSYE
jgi:hypothetical protein